jgi:ribosomal protein S25
MSKYPVKEFLKKHSQLVKLREKEQSGKKLTKQEAAQENRIYELRDETFRRIKKEISRYYERVINGNYPYDGMPSIERGICG